MQETRIVKARATKQQRTGICERKETNKMSPPGADRLPSPQAVAQAGTSRGLLHLSSLGQERELKIQREIKEAGQSSNGELYEKEPQRSPEGSLR